MTDLVGCFVVASEPGCSHVVPPWSVHRCSTASIVLLPSVSARRTGSLLPSGN
jgi:hypothetical protein